MSSEQDNTRKVYFLVHWSEGPMGRFPYINVGSETHGRPSFRLWVSERLIGKVHSQDAVFFPCRAKIHVTERGTRVLKPSTDHVTYVVGKECGYRGMSSFQVLMPMGVETFEFTVYHSPLGKTGVSRYALAVVSPPERIVFQWERSGRTYGMPYKGVTCITPDGEVQELGDLEDGLDEVGKLTELLDEKGGAE